MNYKYKIGDKFRGQHSMWEVIYRFYDVSDSYVYINWYEMRITGDSLSSPLEHEFSERTVEQMISGGVLVECENFKPIKILDRMKI